MRSGDNLLSSVGLRTYKQASLFCCCLFTARDRTVTRQMVSSVNNTNRYFARLFNEDLRLHSNQAGMRACGHAGMRAGGQAGRRAGRKR